MKTKFSLALALSFMSLSAGVGPVLMAEKVQAQPELAFSEQVSSGSMDVIKQSTELEGVRCTPLLRILGFC